MSVAKIVSRLPEPSTLSDQPTKSYLNQLLRVLIQNFKILEKNAQVSIHDITLTANSATTTVTDVACSVSSIIDLMPMSATAAATTGVFVTTSRGQFVITHNNTADLDRNFRYLLTNFNTT